MGWQDAPVVESAEKPAWASAPLIDVEKFQSQKPASNSVLQEHAPAIGSVIGGLGGMLIPVPGAAPGAAAFGSRIIGSLIGTAFGTEAGTIAQQASQGKSVTSPESIKEQQKNVGDQMMYDIIGNAIGAGVVKTLNAAVPAVREGAKKAQQMLRGEGGSLSASQAAESPAISLVESYARAGAGGKGQFITLEKRNADALQAIKDNLIESVSKAPVNDRVAGKIFQDAIAKGDAAHAIASTALYKDFDSRVGDAMVDTLPVQQMGQTLSEQFKRIADVGKSDAGGKLIDQLSKLPNTMSFSDAHILRSNLLATIRDLKTAGTESVALRNATLAAKELESAMETSAKDLTGDLYSQYRQISAFYKKGKEAFNNDVITRLVAEQPERVGEALFRSGNVSEIIQAKASLRQAAGYDNTVDAADSLARLRSGYLNAVLTGRSAVNIEGETTAQNLMKMLADSKTSRQFAVMFDSSQREAIADFGRTAYLTLRNKPSQFGILAPLLQAQSIGNLLSGGAVGQATGTQRSPLTDVGIIISPWALASVLTNPKAVTVLTKALKLPEGATAAGPVMTKLVGEFTSAMQEGAK